MYLIVFDTVLRRPGGATIQVILGGDPGIASLFPEETRLTFQTPDMKLFQVDGRELTNLIKLAIKASNHPVH